MGNPAYTTFSCYGALEVVYAIAVIASVVESWDRRENNLKKRVHLLTAAKLKRRGITRYDAEMLLSQGFSLPEPKTAIRSPAVSKSRLKASTPQRSSPRTQSRVLMSSTKSNQATPTSASPMSVGSRQKSVKKRMTFVRRNDRRRVSRPRVASRRLRFTGSRKLRRRAAGARNNPRTRPVVKRTMKLVDSDQPDFGDDEDDGGSLGSSLGCCKLLGRTADVDIALSMSCDDIESDENRWMVHTTMNSTETVLTPSKLRTRPRLLPTVNRSTDDSMPLLKKELTVSSEVASPRVGPAKLLRSSDPVRGDDMPVLEKEEEESGSAFGADSSMDSGWTSESHQPQSLANRHRRNLDVTDRRFGYDTREWRVPKLTIRRRRASGQSSGNSSGQVSSTSSSSSGKPIYEILRTPGHGSVESQPPSDDSCYSDQRSTTATSSPDSISPSCFYSDATTGTALKRLRLKFGEESVAIDVGRS